MTEVLPLLAPFLPWKASGTHMAVHVLTYVAGLHHTPVRLKLRQINAGIYGNS
jgi:hypothetical protein